MLFVVLQTGEILSAPYRFMTKGHQWLWLQSRFTVVCHQYTGKPEYVSCTHTVNV